MAPRSLRFPRAPWACLLPLFLLSACEVPDSAPPSASLSAPVVYGADDRVDVYAIPDAGWRDRALQSSVALVSRTRVDLSNPDAVVLSAPTLAQAYGLCPDERFGDQPTAAFCSGTLVDEDLVLTAGHCVTKARECAATRILFGYAMEGPSTRAPLTAEDVFSCSEIVARVQTATLDWAILRLDRKATPRFAPAPLRPGRDALAVGTGLAVLGHPSGLPLKLADGAWVRDGRAASLDYFVANLDTFAGNSGSGVYDAGTGLLAGILVRGVADYAYDFADGCYRVNTCSDTGCGGEESTYALRAVDGLCAKVPGALPCPVVCGDRRCAASETAESCPEDCLDPVPAAWTCDPLLYAAGDGCHCACGAFDPDCEAAPLPAINCKRRYTCSAEGTCVR